MVKKKTIDDGRLTAINEPLLVDGGQLPEDVSEPQEWVVGSWKGHPQYVCVYCKYDVLDDVEKIRQHIQEKHGAPIAPQVRPSVLVADKRGNDVTNQVSIAGGLDGVFEVELKEVNSTTDKDDIEHKTFTIKE